MMTPDRPLRSDAARNHELLLDAAEIEFEAKGPDVSVLDIVRRAGVAKGTFFRHFASKDDLIAAIVGKHIGALIDVAEHLEGAEDAGAALLQFLTVASAQREQYDVSFLLRAGESDDRVSGVRTRLYDSVSVLVDNARTAGAIRTDVTATDVILLMCAPNHVVEYLPSPAPDLWQRYLAIIFDGLRPAGAHQLPVPAPNDAL
ncbi:TetR/AcrR family transcriptional regulator [uncultured Arthrobacter sp.]|uniref:TetR/AcrR family transcriptional regulator n=1 Tax=uncultured Arthrobacter sp. TaxID=114050 RepID=UPI0025DBFA1B|nr:TetR/AcrR family transcriptional regulator [uncultured Arthrobacter sp.]